MLASPDMTDVGQPFCDEPYLPASEKRLILASWNVFLKHGCQLAHFSQRLYRHLIQHCGFIAHFDLSACASSSPRPKRRLTCGSLRF